MRVWYQMTRDEVLETLNVGTDGLSKKQAAERLLQNGENVLQESKKKSAFQVFLSQFADLLPSLCSYFSACPNTSTRTNFFKKNLFCSPLCSQHPA